MTQLWGSTLEIELEMKSDLAWHRWGPYLSDRQWGTVREDYSASGAAARLIQQVEEYEC